MTIIHPPPALPQAPAFAPVKEIRVYCCGNFLGHWGPPPATWRCRKCRKLLDSETVAAAQST